MPMSFKHYISFDDDKISFNNMLCFSISNVPTAMREAKSLLNVCCALKILRDIPSTLWCWIFRCVFRFQPQHLTSTLSLQSQGITKVFRQKINIPLWMPKMVFLFGVFSHSCFPSEKWEGNRDPLNERKQSTVSMAKSLFRSSLRQVDSSSHFFMVEFFQAIFLQGAKKRAVPSIKWFSKKKQIKVWLVYKIVF